MASVGDGGAGSATPRRPHLRLVDDTPDDETVTPWPILVVDDEEDVHRLFRLIVDPIRFRGRPVEIVSAYSAVEARRILAETSVSLVLLDVVMESDTAGLDLVDHIRTNLHDRTTRIILVTGQPGAAPELDVVADYDINGYVNKAELSSQYVTSLIVTSLRMFDGMQTMSAMTRNQHQLTEALREQNDELDRVNRRLREQLAANEWLRDELASVDEQVDALAAGRVDELVMQAERAELANEAKSEFITAMNHELRNPLQTILSNADLMLTDDSSPRTEHDVIGLTAISRASQHMLAIVNDILELAKIESGTRTTALESVSVAAVCSEVYVLMEQLAAQRRIDFVNSIADDVPLVLGNERGIKQALINLISNAIKYNRPGGTVDVLAAVSDGSLEVAVVDSGIGIPTELHDRIFQPFERFSSEEAGTGVGLTITRRLLREMHSELAFVSVEGEGSRFSFRLPIAPAST